MAKRINDIDDSYGRPVPGVRVEVFRRDGPLAICTDDLGAPLNTDAHPIIANASGVYSYNAAPGIYRERYTRGGTIVAPDNLNAIVSGADFYGKYLSFDSLGNVVPSDGTGTVDIGTVKAPTISSVESDLAEIAYKLGLGGAREPLIPTVAITFDFWPDAYDVAFPLMVDRDLVGTYFVDYRTIDNTDTAGGVPEPYNIGMTTNKLLHLKSVGWTVGAYLGGFVVGIDELNMVELMDYNRTVLATYFSDIKAAFRAKTLGEIGSAAANQRAWDSRLRAVSQGVWSRVRVGSQTASEQDLPVPDLLYIDRGSPPSLDNGDTSSTINAQITAFLAQDKPGLLTFVIHKVGSPVADYTVGTSAFVAMLDRIAAERDAGTLRVIGYDELR